MKRNITFILVAFAFLSFVTAFGIGDVISALKSGNASQVSKYMDNTIDITLPSKSGSYSKSQAELILKDFFSGITVKGFTIIHQGDNGGSQYVIGTLSTTTVNYRTTIYMKQKGDVEKLQEIRFENK